MRPLFASFVKELRLLGRDLHGLALLFVLPLVFIVVMSLALQDLFDARAGHGVGVLVIDRGGGELSRALHDGLAGNAAFALTDLAPADAPSDAQALKKLLRSGEQAFALEIAADYDVRLRDPQADLGDPPVVAVTVAADTSRQMELVFLAALREALNRQRLEQWLERLEVAPPAGLAEDAADPIAVAHAYASPTAGEAPSAVQQNVPAWLVFALFFVAVPFSNAFIRERQDGTQRRLRTTNIRTLTLFLGKLAPYFAVNQVQVALMLAAGVFLVPRLGGDALRLNGDVEALFALSAALSVAALGLALLIAVTARTTEQATLTAGLGNIVLAAIGGVMVPTFVMPEAMQAISSFSPMAWGVEGFLELFLRGGGVEEIGGELMKLLAFGGSALLLAWALYRPQE